MRYVKGILWMVNQRAKEMKKAEFKGSSKKGNMAINRNVGRQLKKTFK